MKTNNYKVFAHINQSTRVEVVYEGSSKKAARNKAHWMLKSGQSERSYIYCDGEPLEKYVFTHDKQIKHIKWTY